MRKTKLVCTIGPASVGRVRALVDAGMDVARINLSHGTHDDVTQMVEAIRTAAADAGRVVGILADLAGPKVRLGPLDGDALTLAEGARFILHPDDHPGNGLGASTTHAGLGHDLRAGDRVLLSDGAVELRVLEAAGSVVTEVVRGGTVRSRAGVNVPAERLSLEAITDKDREDLAHVLRLGVDIVALSFVRNAADVDALRALIGDAPVDVLAKIETGPAVRNADAIMAAADAVMIARGDLGVELPYAEIPVVQKDLVRRALACGCAVVVATQMLDSMIGAPRPTRAEASDVANAVFEGADAIMLSGETAIGAYPVESAAAAARIAAVADPSYEPPLFPRGPIPDDEAIARAAALLARSGAEVAAIACYSRTGRTAMLMSRVRPHVPILAFGPDPATLRRLTIRRAVHPLLAAEPGDTDAMILLMDEQIRAHALAPEGSLILMSASIPAGAPFTNFLKVHRLGSG